MPEGLVVHPVGREAEAGLRDILRASFLAAYGDLVPRHRFDRMLADDPLFGPFPHAAANNWRHLLAERDGDPVAFLQYAIIPSATLIFVGRLFVLPEAQRQGIGSELLAAVVDQVPEARHVVLNIAAHFAPAAAFYRRHGFRPPGRREGEPFALATAPPPRPMFRIGDTVMGGHDPLDLPVTYLAVDAARIPHRAGGLS